MDTIRGKADMAAMIMDTADFEVQHIIERAQSRGSQRHAKEQIIRTMRGALNEVRALFQGPGYEANEVAHTLTRQLRSAARSMPYAMVESKSLIDVADAAGTAYELTMTFIERASRAEGK